MKVAVVTGGLGFIGMHLVRRLQRDGWAVTVVDDLSTHRRRPTIPDVDDFIERRAQDVDDWRIPTADAIFHLASKVGPLGVMRWSGNIAPDTIDAALAAHRWADGAPLIDVSTSEIYGLREDGICSEEQARIISPGHSARMEYAVAKLAAETMLLNRGGDVRIVRPFNVAGPGQQAYGGFVLPRFIDQAKQQVPLTVYQPGTQRRAFTHVDDIIDGLIGVLERGRAGEAYNLGNPANASTILELAVEVLDVTGSPAGYVIVDPVALHGQGFYEAAEKLPDATKAMTELGWLPTRDRLTTILDAMA